MHTHARACTHTHFLEHAQSFCKVLTIHTGSRHDGTGASTKHVADLIDFDGTAQPTFDPDWGSVSAPPSGKPHHTAQVRKIA
jgi:hypothetical protein